MGKLSKNHAAFICMAYDGFYTYGCVEKLIEYPLLPGVLLL